MDLGPRYVLSWKCYGQNRYDPYHLYTVLLLASGHLSSSSFVRPGLCFLVWWAEIWTEQIGTYMRLPISAM